MKFIDLIKKIEKQDLEIVVNIKLPLITSIALASLIFGPHAYADELAAGTPEPSSVSLSKLANEVSTFLAEGFYDAGIYTDLAKGLVVVDTTASASNFLASSALDEVDKSRLQVNVVDDFSVELNASVVGGGNFNATCTGGFPATRSGVFGILVNAHCIVPSTFNPGTYLYNGVPVAQVIIDSSTGSDVAFATVGNSSNGLTKISGTIFKQMSGAVDPSPQKEICTYGKESGQHCSFPLRFDYTLVSQGYTYQHNTMISNSECVAGDSGGPAWTIAQTGQYFAVGMIEGRVVDPMYGPRCIITNISNVLSVSDGIVIGGVQ